jgi:hypothetical protein
LHGNAPRNIFQVARDIIETKSIAMKFYKKNEPQKHNIKVHSHEVLPRKKKQTSRTSYL